VYDTDEIPAVEVRDGVRKQVLREVDSMVGVSTLEPGLEVGPHSHPWERIAFILEGECAFQVVDDVVRVGEGDLFVVPPNVEHYADPSPYDEGVVNVDVWPLQEGYLPRTEYQSEFATD
jgi:quercetin dioxygenase-like cupin family protein